LQSSQTAPRLKDLKDRKLFDSSERNAITWMDDDLFSFGYTNSTSPKSSSDDEAIVFENPEIEHESECSCGAKATTAAVEIEPQPITFSFCQTEGRRQTRVGYYYNGVTEMDYSRRNVTQNKTTFLLCSTTEVGRWLLSCSL